MLQASSISAYAILHELFKGSEFNIHSIKCVVWVGTTTDKVCSSNIPV